MAVDNSRSTKRQRRYIKRKLDVNESVEVRSMEQGFLGSWHLGKVIQCGKLKRYVRYENLLDDDGVNYLVDEVIVPKALDCDDSDSSNCYIRGSIRPIPPFIEFEEHELEFGLCVDVDHQEAWWEGVIFDHCYGKQERSVFFPDLGDEMKIEVHKMRITHDWDEATRKWRRRGKWVFLELLEECERTSFVAVSKKQVWYDVRTKKDFVRIKEWTYNVKDLWRDPVMEVVGDYLSLTLKEISSSLDLPRSLLKETQELESVEHKAIVHSNQGIPSQQSTSKTLPYVTLENASMRAPKLPLIRPPCPSPTAVRPTFVRPTAATAIPNLHAPVPPPLFTAPTPTVVQPPSTSARSSPPPNEAITSETIETSPTTTSKFLRCMRFMPTPGFKVPKKMD